MHRLSIPFPHLHPATLSLSGSSRLQPSVVFQRFAEEKKLKFFDEVFVPSFGKLLIVGAAYFQEEGRQQQQDQQQQQQQDQLQQQQSCEDPRCQRAMKAQEEFEEHLAEVQSWLQMEDGRTSPTFLHLMIWPWIHRLPVLETLTGFNPSQVRRCFE